MYIKRILLAIALLGLVVLGYFSYQIYTAVFSPNTAFPSSTADVYIPSNANRDSLRRKLQPKLKNWDNFLRVAKRKAYLKNIKPGHYILEKGMNTNEIINTLRSKNIPINVIFNNQNYIENLAGRVAKQIEADSLALLHTMQDTAFYRKHNIDSSDILSTYVPNKYEFYWNTSAKGFRKRMLEEYNRFWNSERLAKAKKAGLSKEEVSVLASIVKSETSKKDERNRVAGVYINRLKRGWKLQADPTVIFALKKQLKDRDTIIKRVLYKDLEIESPYNTYLHTGLPPGPIAMPDISSIEAVLNYEQHDYLYFVGDPENPGYHQFAKSLRQHNINKKHYQRWINRQGIMR